MVETKRTAQSTKGNKKKARTPKMKNTVLDTGSEPVVEPIPEKIVVQSEPAVVTAAAVAPKGESTYRMKDGDPYCIQVYFDRTQRVFVAASLEFPELKVTASSREAAVRDLEERLEDHISLMLSRGENPVEAFLSRTYPERLEIPVSQTLYRKLDLLSRQEKLALDRLVVELLSGAVERRFEGSRGQQRPQQPGQQFGHSHGGNRQHQQHGHRHGNRNQGQNRFRELDSRENFMEYVRNLEKGGNWKKR